MAKREIAGLCCKVLSIYALVQALIYMHDLWSFLSPFDHPDIKTPTVRAIGQMLYGLQPIMLLGLSMFLWRWSGLISAWMAGYDLQDHRDELEGGPKSANLIDVQAVVYSSLGLWLLIEALPRVALHALFVIHLTLLNKTDREALMTWRVIEDMGALTVRLALGCCLALQAWFGSCDESPSPASKHRSARRLHQRPNSIIALRALMASCLAAIMLLPHEIPPHRQHSRSIR